MIISKYLIVVLLAIITCLIYFYFYFYRMNKVIKNVNVNVLRFSPKIFNTIIFTVACVLLTTLSITDVVATNRELSILEKAIIEDQYIQADFPNEFIENTYRYNNSYFGGFYMKDDEYILCITDDSPQALIDYLDGNITVQYVKYSYSELLQVEQIIAYDAIGNYHLSTTFVDIENNFVFVGVTSLDINLENYSNYVDSNMVYIELTERYEVR